MYIVLGSMYKTMSISTGLYPNLDLWNANKLHYITEATDPNFEPQQQQQQQQKKQQKQKQHQQQQQHEKKYT